MRRAALALAAACAIAAVGFGVVPVLTRDRSLTVAANTFVNRPGLIEAHNSPSVAANPRRTSNLVVAHRVDRPGFSASLDVSEDGGRSWVPSPLPLPAGLDRPFAPDAAFAPDGTLFVTYVNLTGPGNVPDNLWVARSIDGGRSLSAPVRVAGALAFQARATVGPDATLYLTWLQADSVGVLRLSGRPARVVLARSTDGGRTFSVPVPVSDAGRERVGAASPVVTGPGRVVVLYQDFTTNRRDFENLEGPPWEDPSALVVARSTDGGRTFGEGMVVDAGLVPARRFLVFLPEFPSLAAGADGTLYVAWADGRGGDEDVFVRRSPDEGASWSAPVRVTGDRAGDGSDQYLPRVAVAPDGRVDVVFYDRRADPTGQRNEVWLASSRDGGRSFHDLRISSTSFDAGIGPSTAPHLGVDLGSRLGLVSLRRAAVAVWTDTRLGTESTGRQDVVSGRVSFPAPAVGDWRRLGLAAALLLGGGAVLAAERLRWRPRGGPWPTAADPKPAGAPEPVTTVAPDGARSAGGGRRSCPAGLFAAALFVGLWASLPAYSGPALNIAARVEIADHLVPSVVMLALVLASVLRGVRWPGTVTVAGAGIVVAGVWMVATHVPLVAQALRGEAPWGATAYHVLPGVAVLVIGAAWMWWAAGAPSGARPATTAILPAEGPTDDSPG